MGAEPAIEKDAINYLFISVRCIDEK